MAEYRYFRVPPVVIQGVGASEAVGDEIKRRGCTRALVVTDPVMTKTGVVDKIVANLKQYGVDAAVYDQIAAEPTDQFVEAGLKTLKSKKCDVVVALGGGSPIDTAKAIAIMATNKGKIADYMGIGKVPQPGLPIVAIPTTAGTGSEVTLFTIITDTKKDVKMLIGTPHAMPAVAVLDPLLTVSMPRGITAGTGLDALTHAIEAYVSLKAQPMTDHLALRAIEMISGNLRQAWSNPNNLKARTEMLIASCLAGMAFSNASVALVHGMSRPVGAMFHVAHGVSNAALLGVVMDFSLIGNPARYADIAAALGENVEGLTDLEAAEVGVMSVRRLVSDLNVPSLSELGVKKVALDKVVEKMAHDAIASGSPGNNPRIATQAEIIELYYRALEA